MEKKRYIAPDAVIYHLNAEQSILAGSELNYSNSTTDNGSHEAESKGNDDWDEDY